MSELLEEIERRVTPLLSEAHVELVDVTYQKTPSGWTLCFYLDKPGGITLDDCAHWSDKLGELLDQEDLIQQSYSLEVSSPGLNRPLKKLADFKKYSGEWIEVKLYAPKDGQKNFHGTLKDADEETVRMTLDDKRDIVLLRTEIAKANLDPQIDI